MHMSRLLIDVGDDPDKHRPGREWLRDIYAVHQRLCMAFPDELRKRNDPHYIQPYAPQDFTAARARDGRSSTAGILYRVDPLLGNRAMILVQSALKPDWQYAFQNAWMLLAAEPEVATYDPVFRQGQRHRFRILMNLSRKVSKSRMTGESLRRPHPKGELDSTGRLKSQGKRAQLTWPDKSEPVDTIRPWFERKAGNAFTLDDFALLKLGWVYGFKPLRTKDGSPGPPGPNYKVQRDMLRFRSALLEGILRVDHAAALNHLVAAGIGAAKAFGFGLLSARELP